MKRVTLTCQLRPDFIESGLREVQEYRQRVIYGTGLWKTSRNNRWGGPEVGEKEFDEPAFVRHLHGAIR